MSPIPPDEIFQLLQDSASAHLKALAQLEVVRNNSEAVQLLGKLQDTIKAMQKVSVSSRQNKDDILENYESTNDDTASRRQISEKNRKAIEKVKEILRISDSALSTSKLVEMLNLMKIKVHDRDQVSYLSALLNKSPEILKTDDGWGLSSADAMPEK